MRNAADQAAPLIRVTRHRIIRELFEQFVAYGRAYANTVANYKPANNGLASANVNAASALIGICNSISYGAASRSIATKPAPSIGLSRHRDPRTLNLLDRTI